MPKCLLLLFLLLAAPLHAQPSPNGTRLPPATSLVDASGVVWTINAARQVLRNGLPAGSGFGTMLVWSDGTVSVLGTDNAWWRWTGTAWVPGTAPLLPSAPLLPPPTDKPVPLPGGGGVSWEQPGASLAEVQDLTYRIYQDALPPVVLTGVRCAAKSVSPWTCTAPFPTGSIGVVHTITLTASNAAGETVKSAPYTYVLVVVPRTPAKVGVK